MMHRSVLAATTTISADKAFEVDFTGTSCNRSFGINSPLQLCHGLFGLRRSRCAICHPGCPTMPTRLSPWRDAAPPDRSSMPPRPAAPVACFHIIGQMLARCPSFGCLRQAIPDRARRGGRALYGLMTFQLPRRGDRRRISFAISVRHQWRHRCAARQGRPLRRAYPSGVRERRWRSSRPPRRLLFWQQEFAPRPRGPARHRGGHEPGGSRSRTARTAPSRSSPPSTG